jgi:hypothetical protein
MHNSLIRLSSGVKKFRSSALSHPVVRAYQTNDYIRQVISSSPLLSKIFVTPTTSTQALVLRTSMRVCTFRIFMEQRAVIRFLTLKGLLAFAIAAELTSVDETGALALSTAKMWRTRFAEGRTRTSLSDDLKCGILLINDLSEAISSMLKERPCLSYKVLCRALRITRGTCLRILHHTLSMQRFHLRWVLHALDTNQKAKRVTLSHGILSVLSSIRFTGFQSLTTGDKSRFFRSCPRDLAWAPLREEVPERVSQKTTQKSV